MIKVGYTKTDGTDVLHETVASGKAASESIALLADNKSGDTSINCFYLEMQITETEWEKYAFVDPL